MKESRRGGYQHRAAQLWLRAIETRRREGGGGGAEAEMQANRLMWITVGQTSERTRLQTCHTAACLRLTTDVLVPPSPVMLPNLGCFDPMSVFYKYIVLSSVDGASNA